MKKCFFALLALCVSGFPAFCQEKTYKVGDVFYEDSEVVGGGSILRVGRWKAWEGGQPA